MAPSLSALVARARAALRRDRPAAPSGPMLIEHVGELTDADVAEVRAVVDEAARQLRDGDAAA